MAGQDARVPGAERLGGLDVVQLPQHQRHAPHDAGDARREHDRERDDDVRQPGAQRGHEGDRQQRRRKRHQPVHDPHQDTVQPVGVPG